MSARGLLVGVLTSALALGAVLPASAGSEPVPQGRGERLLVDEEASGAGSLVVDLMEALTEGPG